jgi:hypothetical protein
MYRKGTTCIIGFVGWWGDGVIIRSAANTMLSTELEIFTHAAVISLVVALNRVVPLI